MSHADNSGIFGFKTYSIQDLMRLKKVFLVNLKKEKLKRQKGSDNGNILMAVEERILQLEHEILTRTSC